MQFQLRKRRMIQAFSLLPWLAGCASQAGAAEDPQRRFKGIGLVLVVDAVPGAELKGVKMFDDRNIDIFSSATVAKRNRATMSVGSGRVPLTVRTIWRQGEGWDSVKKVWNNGVIIGDYSIAVAERIPQAVLDSIRREGGGLRLKYRLKADGVLFGWDIERDGAGTGYTLKFDMPGGDFLETRY